MSLGSPWSVDHASTGTATNRYSRAPSTAAEAASWAAGTSLVELVAVPVRSVMGLLRLSWRGGWARSPSLLPTSSRSTPWRDVLRVDPLGQALWVEQRPPPDLQERDPAVAGELVDR